MLKTKTGLWCFPSYHSHVLWLKLQGEESPPHCPLTTILHPKQTKKDNRQPQTTVIGGHGTRKTNVKLLRGERDYEWTMQAWRNEKLCPALRMGVPNLLTALSAQTISLSVLEGLISVSSGNSADRPWQLSLLNAQQLHRTEHVVPGNAAHTGVQRPGVCRSHGAARRGLAQGEYKYMLWSENVCRTVFYSFVNSAKSRYICPWSIL